MKTMGNVSNWLLVSSQQLINPLFLNSVLDVQKYLIVDHQFSTLNVQRIWAQTSSSNVYFFFQPAQKRGVVNEWITKNAPPHFLLPYSCSSFSSFFAVELNWTCFLSFFQFEPTFTAWRGAFLVCAVSCSVPTAAKGLCFLLTFWIDFCASRPDSGLAICWK